MTAGKERFSSSHQELGVAVQDGLPLGESTTWYSSQASVRTSSSKLDCGDEVRYSSRLVLRRGNMQTREVRFFNLNVCTLAIHGLPLIDSRDLAFSGARGVRQLRSAFRVSITWLTNDTLAYQRCDPPPKECSLNSKYRNIDGSCNNFLHPYWGSPERPFGRLVGYNYGDDGKLGQDGLNLDKCVPIMIEDEDKVYAPAGIECLDFQRTSTDKDKGCHSPGQPVKQLNAVTSFLDLSVVYGSSDEVAKSLRTFTGGRLKVACHHGEDFPPQADNVTQTCDVAASKNELCDVRINQNPQLTSLQVLWLREHNRVADGLRDTNPHWDDDQLYNEARRITIGEHQHVTYNEYLPLQLGTVIMEKFRLLPAIRGGCVDDYDPTVNPTTLDEHTTGGALRYFHSAVSGHLKLVNQKRNVLGEARLSDWFNRPESLANNTILNYNRLCTGLATQMEERVDQFFDTEITNYLFRGGQELGSDLRAIDIQRCRDHGIGTYNQIRKFCNLTVPRSFDDLANVTGISEKNVELLRSLYEDVNDMDLTVAGSLEPHRPGANGGDTYLCILTEHFRRSRVGDRYFYENCEEGKFTTEQLREIRKTSLSRLFCDNVNAIKKMQRKAFEPVSSK
ncbi:Peroxidase [Eumeta japonica]|uniref:Peroxidase n=1 Tax=Eumeta variegata TaxID=151549 RepID=A0A4C1WAZ5_EUMVA|nr:Peroxidase [Eumeta japonica]